MARKKQNAKITKKQEIEKLSDKIKQCHLSEEPKTPTGNTILDDDIKPKILAKWSKLKLKIPPIFLHKPVDFEHHVKKVLNLGINFYQPHLGKNYTKIICQTNNDHKHMIKYLEKKQLPFHTFGNPSKQKMKVVIRGLPQDLELLEIKDALKSVFIPVIRVHKMHTKTERKDKTMLVLAVVPYDNEGKTILKVTQILGHYVKLEPPVTKPRQCYRCQKWGHSQRYCHGTLRCVKCAEEHLYKKCDKGSDEPPTCANCGAAHTANYKYCMVAPDSEYYQIMKKIKIRTPCYKPMELVTMENYQTLYKNVDYNNNPSKDI